MRLPWRRRTRPRAVTFQDEHSTPMSLWEVRSGMLITATDYRHDSAELTVRVTRDPSHQFTCDWNSAPHRFCGGPNKTPVGSQEDGSQTPDRDRRDTA